MPRDLKKKDVRRSKRLQELKRQKKRAIASDSDSDDSFIETGSEEEEFDMNEYRKFLAKKFPSKYLNKKIKDGDKLKSINKKFRETKVVESESESEGDEASEEWVSEDDDEWSTENDTSSEQDVDTSKEKIQSKKHKSKKSKKVTDSDYEGSETITEDSEYVDGEDADDDDDDGDDENTKGKNLNIIFTISNRKRNIDYDDAYGEDGLSNDEENDDTETEDEDVEVSSDDTESGSGSGSETDEPAKKSKSTKKKCCRPNRKHKSNTKENPDTSIETIDTLNQLKQLLEANPHDKSIKKCIAVYEAELQKQKERTERKNKKQRAKNMRIFKKILKDKNTTNDFSFYDKLDMEQQKKIIKELKEINKVTRIEKPYRMTLLESSIPVQFKATAMKKINTLRYMEPGSGEYYKNKNWVDTFMRIPFNTYEGLPISVEDGVEKCHDFMENAQKILDKAVYGLNDAKMQIMQMLGQLVTNPKAIGSAIAIHGPPGTGKTSLVKEGISKILNRPFAFIALGGATDSSFLEGHGYTYEGSTWGKIVQILIDSKCMNPVIYFDELDKISDTPRGEEIVGILTHLTDTSQNSQFHDKYFAEIDFDLSKCLFIFSYNDETKVNPILKDRMYRIKTKGYSAKEKTVIANDYLLPKLREQVRFKEGDIDIPNEVIGHIIDTHCNKEDGVRNLKRSLEIIYTKLNLYRLMRPGSNLFESEMSMEVAFPYLITKTIVDKLIKKETDGLETWRSLYT